MTAVYTNKPTVSTLESPGAGATFRYDGRDYLTQAEAGALPFQDGFESGDLHSWTETPPAGRPTYSSEGLLHALQRNSAPERSLIFNFAGRPVTQLDLTGGTESWTFLTTDHLGTPVAATGAGGALLWQGGFEPFGADWSGAAGAGVFLRFPGQWEEAVFAGGGLGGEIYYNVHRWYEVETGRYTRPDPLPYFKVRASYYYAFNSPVTGVDPDGQTPKPFFAGKWCDTDKFHAEESDSSCRDCDVNKTSNRLSQVQRLKARKCSQKHQTQITPIPGTEPIAGVDWDNNPRAWYIPQGDRCIDECLCAHENYHVRQALGLEPSQERTVNGLECDAYGVEERCLSLRLLRSIKDQLPFR